MMKHIIRKILKEEDDLQWMKDTESIKPLVFETKTVHWVDYYYLERFMESVYGDKLGNFSIPSDLESSNDVTHELSADADEEPYDKELFEEWKNTGEARHKSGHKFTPSVHDLLNDLAKEKLIPEGEWFVRVSW